MPITPEQGHKVSDWARTKGVNLKCPSCKSPHVMTLGELVECSIYNPEEFDVDNTVLWLELVCNNCGFVKLFRASVVGLP